VRLVKLLDIEFEIAPYSMLAKPHWVDVLVDRLKEMARARLTVQIARERVKRLDYAVRRITQRVNLFEKILIPTAEKNIQRIQIFLGDADRSAIVRSKIAKAMRAAKRAAFFAEEGS
jgi:V/A-type H+-transporting ATPase subunit D